MSNPNPITVSSGQVMVDSSVIPFIRKSDVEFAAVDMKPLKAANFFFDEILVNRFVQNPSVLTASQTTDLGITRGTRLYNYTTKAFATAVDVAANNIIYLNENFVTVNISGVSLSASSYAKGDIVYQNGTATGATNASSNTFTAKVEYWDVANTILVLTPVNGTLNSASSVANTLFKVPDTTATTKVRDVLGKTSTKRFDASQVVVNVDNPSTSLTVGSYTHKSGQIIVVDGSTSAFNVSSNVSSTLSNGDTINFTSGKGLGQTRTVSSISADGMRITLSSALSDALDSNTRYSLGTHAVDAAGKISGIFTIPEDNLLKFRTGERLFTITDVSAYDDQDAQMKSVSRYIASGFLNRTQEIRFTPIVIPTPPAPQPVITPSPPVVITPTQPVPVIPRRRRDPVAQTFFTPNPKSIKQNYGIFVTSIDLFFKNKPDAAAGAPQLPVTVRIVKTLNGFPTQEILAVSTVYPINVKTTNGTSTLPDSTDSSTYTRFSFGDPVYLEPSTEYAIVIFSESPDYEVWISELGQNILGTNRRVSEQPYAGSFFRSQNASAWTPFQNQDLMFVINKAVFSTSPGTLTYSVESPINDVYMDEFLLHTTDITFPAANVTYFANTTILNSLTRDSAFFEFTPNQLYKFGKDLKTSSISNNRRRVIRAGNGKSMNVQVALRTTDPDISPMFNAERLSLISVENLVNNGSITSNNVTITSGGGNHSSNAGITVSIGAPQLSNGVQATAIVLTSQIVGGNITGVFMTNIGSGYIESPTITIADTGVSGFANATAVVTSEDSNFGGNAKARYITRKITLADGFDAGDLRLFISAARPQGTSIIAYYKVLSSEDPTNFFDKKWKRMELVQERFSVDQDTPIELQFRPSTAAGKLSYIENDVEYPLGGKFKDFAIKLVLLAEDPSVVPYVKNLRVIATPEG